MTRLVMDARLAGHSGIGVYLEHLLPRVLPHLAPWRPVILARSAVKVELASRLGPDADVRDWDVPPLGMSNLWHVPPAAGPRDLLWTPHFNVPLLRKGPMAVTLHDVLPLAVPRLAGRGQAIAVRLWLGAIRARARIVFCVSDFTRREAIARATLDTARLVVTPLGVDSPWRVAATTATRPTDGEAPQPTIICVGLMKRHKNLARLLEAFDQVKERIPHRLVMVARGVGLRSIDPEVMPWVRALGDRVELIETLPLAELVTRVRSADFAALASLYEGFGLPALEAMAVGTPVLAARAGALPEVCGDAAEYCDPHSVDDIARGLLQLASDQDLRVRLAAAGAVRAAAFSWEQCAAITLAALKTELGRLRSERRAVTRSRTAVVHDWLDTWRGGENVLAEILHVYPEADLLALVDFLPDTSRALLSGKRAATSFLQRLPGARRYFRALLPLFPRAIESLDVTGYDVVISSSHAVAKGVRTASDQIHICYCHTPMRYAWDLREQYLRPLGLASGLRGAIVRKVLDRLRDWDLGSTHRVTHFIANSGFIRERIARCYGRDATVIYPPVDVHFFAPDANAPAPAERDYYVTASRWVPYKRVDLIAAAFRDLPERRLLIAGDGPEAARVHAAAGPNVAFVGEVPRERLRQLLRGARAFVFAAEEDFGILPVEAQACGTPVIAYGKGGSLETIVAGEGKAATGAFFATQTPEAIAAAVRAFDTPLPTISVAACRANAMRFSAERFREQLKAFVESARYASTQMDGIAAAKAAPAK